MYVGITLCWASLGSNTTICFHGILFQHDRFEEGYEQSENGEGANEARLTAEMLKHAPEQFFQHLLLLFNGVTEGRTIQNVCESPTCLVRFVVVSFMLRATMMVFALLIKGLFLPFF